MGARRHRGPLLLSVSVAISPKQSDEFLLLLLRLALLLLSIVGESVSELVDEMLLIQQLHYEVASIRQGAPSSGGCSRSKWRDLW